MVKTNIIDKNSNNIIKPYLTTDNYDIYIFQQGSNLNLAFDKTCIGDIIITGPGGDGGMNNTSNLDGGGIGSAVVYQKDLTFYGKDYTYELIVPTGTIPFRSTFNSSTSFTGININLSVVAKSFPQTSYGYSNSNKISEGVPGGVTSGFSLCYPGTSTPGMPIIYSPLSFWFGGGGSGGNIATSGLWSRVGGLSGHGIGGANAATANCSGPGRIPGDDARYINNWYGKPAVSLPFTNNDIFAGNGGGGGGLTYGYVVGTGGLGSPGIIVIIIKSIIPNRDTFYELGYTNDQYYLDNTQLLSKIVNKNKDSIKDLEFNCPSTDGSNCINNNSTDFKNIKLKDTYNLPPLENISEIKCEYAYDPKNILDTFKFNNNPNSINIEACNKLYDKYNLYPTNNPLAVIGHDIDSSIINTITNTNDIALLASQYQNQFPNINSDEQIIKGFNQVLKDTPLKLGCCKRIQGDDSAKSANVKVSLTPEVNTNNKLLSKLNYQNQIIKIPENTCPTNLYNGSDDCNIFHEIYCKNFYDYLQSKDINNSDKLLQIPECACYFPKTQEQIYYPPGTPALCYKDKCQLDSGAYLDPTSYVVDSTGNKTTASCNMTICTNIVQAGNIGGSAAINPNLENNCGSQIEAAKQNNINNTPKPTPTPTPGPTPTPSPTPSPGPSPGPTPTPSPGPTPSPTPTPSPGPTPSPTPTPGPINTSNEKIRIEQEIPLDSQSINIGIIIGVVILILIFILLVFSILKNNKE